MSKTRDLQFVAYNDAGFPFGSGRFTSLWQAAKEFPKAARIDRIDDSAEYSRLLQVHLYGGKTAETAPIPHSCIVDISDGPCGTCELTRDSAAWSDDEGDQP